MRVFGLSAVHTYYLLLIRKTPHSSWGELDAECFQSNFNTTKRLKNALAQLERNGYIERDGRERYSLTGLGREQTTLVLQNLGEIPSIRWRHLYGELGRASPPV